MKKKYAILLLLFVCSILNLSATNDTPSYLDYVKNNGQWNSKVLYQADFRGGRLFLEKNAFTYLFYPLDKLNELHPHANGKQTTQSGRTSQGNNNSLILNFHAVRMEFVGSLANANAEQINKKEFYHNYYWAAMLRSGQVKYPLARGLCILIYITAFH